VCVCVRDCVCVRVHISLAWSISTERPSRTAFTSIPKSGSESDCTEHRTEHNASGAISAAGKHAHGHGMPSGPRLGRAWNLLPKDSALTAPLHALRSMPRHRPTHTTRYTALVGVPPIAIPSRACVLCSTAE
jgi:hypothetical protein